MAAQPKLYDHDTERQLVGAALIEPGLFCDTIDPEAFYLETCRAIWEAGRDLARSGKKADLVTLGDELERRGTGIKTSELAKLVYETVSTAYADQWAATVSGYAARRALYNIASTAMMRVQRSGDLDALLAQISREVGQIQERRAAAHPATDAATWAKMAEQVGPVAWEWAGWLPAGLLTLLVGESGAGKSMVALRIAASYLIGWPWPDGTEFDGSKGGQILWVEAEAAQALNLSRAQGWGLPCEHILSPLANPLDDVNLYDAGHRRAIEELARGEDVRLIVVDSLSEACGGREKAEDMMPVVLWLSKLARDVGKPALLLHHLRKRGLLDTGDKIALDRVRGSTVIVQPARVVWALDIPNSSQPDNRRLSVIKSNLARFPTSIGLTVGDSGPVFGAAPEPPRHETQLDKAADLLMALLNPRPDESERDRA